MSITEITNQEIFEALSEHEEMLFYAACANADNEAIRAAHKAVKETLKELAKATGCHL